MSYYKHWLEPTKKIKQKPDINIAKLSIIVYFKTNNRTQVRKLKF